MLFATGLIWVFSIGGLSGLILVIAAVDSQVTDTYFVVGHFHYVLVAGLLLESRRPPALGKALTDLSGRLTVQLLTTALPNPR